MISNVADQLRSTLYSAKALQNESYDVSIRHFSCREKSLFCFGGDIMDSYLIRNINYVKTKYRLNRKLVINITNLN